jgi:hypothetical protein
MGPEKPSVRSMTPSIGVVAAGDEDLEGTVVLRLGCGVFSSSSEEITYMMRIVKFSDDLIITGHEAVNPQIRFDPTNEPGTSNNAKWKT